MVQWHKLDMTLIHLQYNIVKKKKFQIKKKAYQQMKNHRAWQRMLSGRRLDLLDPTPLDIEIEDIAHGLSFVARWNGQTNGKFPYSVAEHSLLVEQIFSKSFKKLEKKWCLAALLHDAPEYVIGDMISPVKSTIGIGYQSLENRLTAAINLRFGLPTKIPDNIKKQIKKADKISAWIEAIQIAGFTKDEADKFFGNVDNKNIDQFTIKLRPPMEVRENYILRFNELFT